MKTKRKKDLLTAFSWVELSVTLGRVKNQIEMNYQRLA